MRVRALVLVLATSLSWTTVGAAAGDACEEGADSRFWPGTLETSGGELAAPSVEFDPLDLVRPTEEDQSKPPTPPPSEPIEVRVYVVENQRQPHHKVTDEQIEANISVLNAAFAGAGFAFREPVIHRRILEHELDPLFLFREHPSLRMGSKEEIALKSGFRDDTVERPHVLHIWSVRTEGGQAWSTFPWHANGTRRGELDGVVIHPILWPGGLGVGLNEGDMLVHEVGHWLGLYHTFEDGCEGHGDHVDDTPAHVWPATVGEDAHPLWRECAIGADSCPSTGLDPIHNYMNYGLDACRWEFTEGQGERMRQKWWAYRDPSAKGGRGKPKR